MPNNGRVTLCPYYRDEKNLSISCEDIFRRFRWRSQKMKWMDIYCDREWGKCPYAMQLDEMYRKIGEDMGTDNEKIIRLEHENEELRKELRKIASMLGRVEKREQAKDSTIRELRRKNRYLEDRYLDYSGKLKKMEAAEDKIAEHVRAISQNYESRFAYLMCEFSGGCLSEEKFEKWKKENKGKLPIIEYRRKDRTYVVVMEKGTDRRMYNDQRNK